MSGSPAGGAQEAGSILTRTAKGAGWIIGWRMSTRVLGVASTLILVRLLVPADFGLVALANGFWQAIDAFASFGVEEAIIREKLPSRALYDTGFTLNALRGVATVVLIVAGAWPVAWFFGEPRLVPVLLALAVGAMANGLENIGIVDFRRHLDFRREFFLYVFPRMASIVVAIAAAFLLRSYWALVIGILTTALLRLLAGYVMHPYRPRLDLSAWREIAGFSLWSWALSVAGLLRDRTDNFVIGRMLGMSSVGIYSVGAEIAALPTTELVSPLGRACFSAFAAARNSGAEMGGTFLRLVGTAAMLGLPAGIGLSLLADPIVKLAFGDRWQGAAPLIELLGVTLTVTIFGTLSVALLNAHAVLRPQFRVQLAAIAVRLVAMVALVIPYGLLGAAIGLSLSLAVENACYTAMAMRRLHVGLPALCGHVWRSLAASLGMAAGLVRLGQGWTEAAAPFSVVLEAVPEGVVLYAVILLVLWHAAGRPAGAEQDALRALTSLSGRFRFRRAIEPSVEDRRI